MLEELRKSVQEAAVAMFRNGLVVGTDGNVSAKDPATGLIAITPSGMPYEQIGVDDVPIVDVQGNIVWGERKPSWETPMHTYIHAHREDVYAVMHTHSRYATLFATANKDIPPVTMNLAAQFGGVVPCAPYARTGSAEMGSVNMGYLGQTGKGILLGNHGTLCVAPTLSKVLRLSEALEEGAKIAYNAAALGELIPLPDEEVKWLFDLVSGFEAEAQEAELKASRSHP